MPKMTFKNGVEVPAFDHNEKHPLVACGYTEQDYEILVDRFSKMLEDMHEKYGDRAPSRIMEALYNDYSKMDAIVVLSVHGATKKQQASINNLLDVLSNVCEH